MAASTWTVKMDDFASFRRRVPLLAQDTPHMRRRMGEAAEALAQEIRGGGGSIGQSVVTNEPKVKGANVRVRVAVLHPAGKVREFGRTKWYRSPNPDAVVGIGNNRPGSKRRRGAFKTRGVAYNRRSIAPRPFVGVKSGNHAIGRAEPRVRELLAQGMADTWDEILTGIS